MLPFSLFRRKLRPSPGPSKLLHLACRNGIDSEQGRLAELDKTTRRQQNFIHDFDWPHGSSCLVPPLTYQHALGVIIGELTFFRLNVEEMMKPGIPNRKEGAAVIIMGCSICLDEDEDVTFICPTKSCDYAMCFGCVKLAFEDISGQNARDCPSCKKPIARRLMESICGVGAVREVERELRAKVEFEVKQANEKRARGTEEMKEMKQRAHKLFLELSEQLNMRCPSCQRVFIDYEGCNALTCPCGTAFCAVCLQDCGTNAHAHARTHGNLFDKNLFHQAKKDREVVIAKDFFAKKLQGEPFDVTELVRIEYETISGTPGSSKRKTISSASEFVETTKNQLKSYVSRDRLSLLADPVDYMNASNHRALTKEDISPRNVIPKDYKLILSCRGSTSVLTVSLYQIKDGKNLGIPLPGEVDTTRSDESATAALVDALVNVKQSLKCCVLALAGEGKLYQTKSVPGGPDTQMSEDNISIVFQPVSSQGDTVQVDQKLSSIKGLHESDLNVEVFGLNQNLRLTLLSQYVDGIKTSTLLEKPIKDFVEGTPQRLFNPNQVNVPPPETFEELNEEQRTVAHPLAIRTAMEVAGPPGTGKCLTGLWVRCFFRTLL